MGCYLFSVVIIGLYPISWFENGFEYGLYPIGWFEYGFYPICGSVEGLYPDSVLIHL